MSPKKNFVSKLRSSLSFRQITNYCNVQFYRICRCVNVFSVYWRFRFWIMHRSNHDTMSTTPLLLFAVEVKITKCRFCIHRNFQSVFITVFTKTELPKTLRSVQCDRKRILSANCEALCHLDKLRITAKCIYVKMCNFIAFAFYWRFRFWIIH